MDYNMIGTAWSLLPPIVAIALALKTKEVYSSLFIGIILGAVQYCISMGTGFDGFLVHLTNHTVGEGDDAKAYGLIHCLSDPWNVGILVFLVVLGSIVSLMNKAGGSAAFGRWASKHVKSKIGVQVATILLGILIFIDDYFNCLTVGSVMRPIAVRNGVTKEKLAYLIDSTAAPVCIISPISSWAAAVSGFVSGGENGLALFCKAIPYNFYAFFTILFMFGIVILGFDFKAMSKYDARLKEWYERTNGGKLDEVSDTKLQIVEHGVGAKQEESSQSKGSVSDLVIPIIMLIIFCMAGMVYSGGFFDTSNANYMNFVDSFAGSNASIGLVIGSLAALILTILMFTVRKTLPFDEAMSSLIKGFEAMVPAILILTLAWTLTRAHASGKLKRGDFEDDMDMPSPKGTKADYYNSGYDRGHLCPAGDNKWNQKAMDECFLMTNMCPQTHALNAGIWNSIEQQCRTWAKKYGKVYIVCGPICLNKQHRKLGKNKVVVPDAFFKVILRTGKNPQAIGFICRNQGATGLQKKDFVNSVDEVERITGYDFFSKLPDNIEKKIEAKADIKQW